MSLVTRCPKCQSDFLVKLDQLQALDGLVRCGACAHIFDGLTTLQSKLPTLTQRPLADDVTNTVQSSATSAPQMPALMPDVLRHRSDRTDRTERTERTHRNEPRAASATVFSEASERVSETIIGESRVRGDGLSVGRTQPEFLVDTVDAPRLKMLLWSLASGLALVLLVIQLVHVYRNDLATIAPALRPALDSLCVKLRCEVSLRRHLERISVSVIAFERQSPVDSASQSAEMILKFSLRNRFNQAQPWPHLALELTDASGTVVLRKRMSPNEYLPAAWINQPFAASQEISLSLPVVVTGFQINGYSLKPFFP